MSAQEDLFNRFISFFPSPYNIGVCIIIVCFLCIKIFYSKYNKDKVEGWEHSNYKKIISGTTLVMMLTILSCGSYYYYDHHIFPVPPKDHFRVAISPFHDIHGDPISKTPEEIKKIINKTAGDDISVVILDPPPVKKSDDAVLKGKKAAAIFCIYGGDDVTLGEATETTLYVLPIDISQSKQLFDTMNKTLFQNSTSEELSSDIENGIITFSSAPYVGSPIILKPAEETIISCVYTICALARYAEHRYDDAVGLFKKIPHSENNSNILFYVGNCYLYQNKFDEAVTAFDKAIKINPHNSETWNNKGIALYELNQSGEAITAFDKAIKINSQNSDAWYNKGLALYKLKEFNEAIKAYDKAIEINPQYSKAWNDEGVALCNLNKSYEAIKLFDKAIEIDRRYSKAWNNKGLALNNLNKYDEAIKAYDKAIEINPHYSDAWYNRACIYSIINKKEQSIYNLTKAIELESSWKEVARKDPDFKGLFTDEQFNKLTK
jgi:tetratricopeptide (TPR) repeat protein